MAMRTLEPGLRLGKYEVVAHIATGGMGAVYKAIDQELRRTVALKVLPSHRAQGANDLERFKREARHAARLTHANIVTLYDQGYDETQDVYFLAMEFVDGHDLAHYIDRKGRLPPQDARRILKQAALALDYAYSQGVIHRDIKPSNFLLKRVGAKIVVKLTDMGLAIDPDAEEFRMTREGRTVGTIDYMAPEQARDSRSADIRSDIYSLGCTAYHMLAGKAPFAEGGLGERVYKHQNVPPADVREVSPSVSAAFWGIVQKMLAKKPDDRYATPSELVADLKRISAEANDDEPELVPLPTTEVPRAAETLREPTTPPPVTASPATSSIDEPRPRKKRPRFKTQNVGIDWRRFIGPGIGLAIFVLVGIIGWQTWKSLFSRKPGPDAPQTKGPDDPRPAEEGSLAKRPPLTVAMPLRDHAENGVEPVARLDSFKGQDWPGREFVPFDAVASRARREEIKAVQLKGRITMAASSLQVNMMLAWDSHQRVNYQESTGVKNTTSILLAGDQGWLKANERPIGANGELLTFLQSFDYAVMLSNLISLAEREFTIDRAENSVIRGRECSSVRVARANRPTVTLFFDKVTNLLYKAEYQARLLDKKMSLQSNATRIELFFTGYLEGDGVNQWRRMEQWYDGKKFSDWTLTEARYFRQSDDALFVCAGLDDVAQRAMTDYRKKLVERGLSMLGDTTDSKFTRLVHGLNQKNPALRWTVRDAVLAYGELWRRNHTAAMQTSDLPALNSLLLSDDNELSDFAIDAFTRMGPQAAKSAPHLLTLAQSSGDPKILAGTLGALRSTAVKPEAVIDLYVKFLDYPDLAVKTAAALALLQLAPERLAVDRVAALMAWPSNEVRVDAGKLLRQKLAGITPKDLPMLREGLRNPVREVRLAFIDAAGSLQQDGQDAMPELVPLLLATDKGIAAQTVRALDRMGKLAELARDHGDPAVMAAALGALRGKALKTPEALDIYAMHLDHANAAVKNVAALALIELGPERLSKERLVELMTRPKPVDLAAALALHKVDPGNANLKTRGTDILVRELVLPDISDLKSFLAQPLQGRAAAVLLDIGAGKAVVPILKHLLTSNNPKDLAENQKMAPTAARFMGYEMLKELAKRAKTKQDRELIAALKSQEGSLKAFWYQQEANLATRMKTLKGVTPEAKQLQIATAEAAYQAYRTIEALRLP